MRMIVTIDGPAGAGKSTTAKALAQRLGFEYLDTGAMYRAVTLAVLRAGVDPARTDALRNLLAGVRLELPPGAVVVDGVDVTSDIRKPEVTAASGAVADSRLVRTFLVDQQRAIVAGRSIICEGRDQGTIVFPGAECKFFLDADPLERARRRHAELAGHGESITVESVLRDQEARDRRDAARDLAPMVPAADAIRIDSTHLNLDQVVDCMEREVRKRIPRAL
jgi:cytidylate kinase